MSGGYVEAVGRFVKQQKRSTQRKRVGNHGLVLVAQREVLVAFVAGEAEALEIVVEHGAVECGIEGCMRSGKIPDARQRKLVVVGNEEHPAQELRRAAARLFAFEIYYSLLRI